MSKSQDRGENDAAQFELFRQTPQPSPLPEGFRYQPEMIDDAMQRALAEDIATLPLRNFDFHGFQGKRRVVSFGWKYDFDSESLRPGPPLPAFLMPLRDLAAGFAGLPAEALKHALVTEYGPGAPIGWHRDKAAFGRVVGISLLAPCTFRLRLRHQGGWRRAALTLAPGSAYLLSGPARTEWEHSIPPVEALRYSVTFREVG